MARKQFSKLTAVLATYGLKLEYGGKHLIVTTKDGRRVSSVASTPSDPYFDRQTIRHLVRSGVLPSEAKSMI